MVDIHDAHVVACRLRAARAAVPSVLTGKQKVLHTTKPNSFRLLANTKRELKNMEEEDTAARLSGHARQVVLDELNVEIGVRERLQETLESRIAWATCLQSSLGAVAENGASIFHSKVMKQRPTSSSPFRVR